MRIALTGATGFIGKVLLPELLAAGHPVRALRRIDGATVTGEYAAPEAGATVDNNGTEWITGTLPDPALCQALCQDREAVIHAAGLAHTGAAAAQLREQNLLVSVQLARAARAQGVRHFVFVSSSKARYPAHSAYAAAKAEAERELLALQTPTFRVLCLRPSLVYGPGMRGNLGGLLRLLARPGLPFRVASAQPLGLIGVRDLARALQAGLFCAALPSGRYELSDGASYTLDDIVYHVRRQLQLPQPRWVLPRPVLKGVAWLSSLLAPVTRLSFSMSTYRTLFQEAYQPNPDFSRLTGFQARDTFYTALPALLTGARA